MTEDNRPSIPWVKSPSGVQEYYANMMHLVWSLDDVRFRIGQLVEGSENLNPGPDFRAVAQENAAVTVSWRNAKLLLRQLGLVVDAYEKVNGEIKIDINLPQGDV